LASTRGSESPYLKALSSSKEIESEMEDITGRRKQECADEKTNLRSFYKRSEPDEESGFDYVKAGS
jgi:hypothetical protein